jgi:hypothetical protein
LLLAQALEDRPAAERSHVDEDRRREKCLKINRHDGRHFRSSRRDIDHLSWAQNNADLGIFRKVNEDLPAQTDHFHPSSNIRNQEVRSCDRRCDGPSLHVASSGAFRRRKQHSAAIQSDFAPAREKTKERIGAYAGNRQVREFQFSPGIAPSFEGVIAPNDIARGGSSCPGQERNEIHRLSDFGALEGLRTEGGRMRDTQQQDESPTLHKLEAEIEDESPTGIHHSIVEEGICRVVCSEVGRG